MKTIFYIFAILSVVLAMYNKWFEKDMLEGIWSLGFACLFVLLIILENQGEK